MTRAVVSLGGVTLELDLDLLWNATAAGDLARSVAVATAGSDREVTERIARVLTAIERGAIDATEVQRTRLAAYGGADAATG